MKGDCSSSNGIKYFPAMFTQMQILEILKLLTLRVNGYIYLAVSFYSTLSNVSGASIKFESMRLPF